MVILALVVLAHANECVLTSPEMHTQPPSIAGPWCAESSIKHGEESQLGDGSVRA